MNAPTSRTIVPENIRNLNGYVPGKTIAEVQEQYRPDRISKLASNENRLGFSADVEPAVQQALRTIQDYPDPVSKRLVSKIAETNQVSESQVLVGAGSESIISILCRTFFLNKEHAITCSTTFVGFFVQIGVRGVRLKKIPPTSDFRFDVKAIVNAVDAHTKMIYIANPNNPTGTYINRSEFEWMMEQVPRDVLVVMDEAYFEFAEDVDDYPNAVPYKHDNVIVLRTFSKAYGLAGFRVGYAIGHEEIISHMIKTKLTFEPTTLGQAAALAAYQDTVFLARSVHMVKEAKQQLYSFFDEHEVQYVPSISNSVMMLLPTEAEAIAYTQAMLEHGVILRRLPAFGIPNGIRITLGTPEEMEHFEQAFSDVTKSLTTN